MKAYDKNRMTSAQRNMIDNYVKREVQRQYDKEIDNAENFGKFFTMIAACEVLEEVFKFGKKRRTDFLDEFVKRCNEISDYLEANTVIEQGSDKPIFDKVYNIEILNRYAEKYGLKFDEGMVEY